MAAQRKQSIPSSEEDEEGRNHRRLLLHRVYFKTHSHTSDKEGAGPECSASLAGRVEFGSTQEIHSRDSFFNVLEDVARGISRSCGVRNSQLSESNHSAFNPITCGSMHSDDLFRTLDAEGESFVVEKSDHHVFQLHYYRNNVQLRNLDTGAKKRAECRCHCCNACRLQRQLRRSSFRRDLRT